MDKTLHILILEDNPADAELMEHELREAGFTFTSKRVTTEDAFVQGIEKFSPDLILSDYDLPLYNGASALAEAKKRCPDTPFILVTGAVTEDRAIEILTSGAWDYVLKTRLQQRLVPAARRALTEAEERKARKKAEEELKESEKRAREQLEEIRSIYDSAHIGLCVLDRGLRYIRINRRLAEINGVPAADHIGKTIYEIVPDIAPIIGKIAERIFQSGEPVLNFEVSRTFPSQPGVHHTLLEHWLPLKDIEGNVNGINVVVEEITEYKRLEGELRNSQRTLESQVKKRTAELVREVSERKRALEELRKSEELYHSLFDNMLNGFAYCKMIFEHGRPQDFIYLEVNSAFESLTGLRNVVGKKVSEVIPGLRESDAELFEIYGRVALTGEPERFERYVEALHMWFSIAVYSPEREYFVAVFDVITERKRAEEELHFSMEKLRKAFMGIIEATTRLVEMRDPYVAGHQHRVAQIASSISREMNLSPEETEEIYLAASIHDIGKIAIPAEILSKPGRLMDVEVMLIKTHSQAGYDILKDLDFPWDLANITLQHHERFNGSGYPRGLKGSEIRLSARIIAVADSVEAMATHRPFRESLGIETALEEISRNKRSLYDPQVVDACLRLFQEKGLQLEWT